jgi:inorganic pyrophosphatase
MINHPWHEVANNFDRTIASVDGLIEIPRGSKAKYEIDKPSGLIRLDRVVFAAFVYPVNYGFIPQTLGDDGDPLDILVLSEVSIQPNCLVRSRVIGYMQMNDTGKNDEKIIAVAEGDMSVAHIQDIHGLPQSFRQELKHFFSNYKTLMNREVKVDDFLPREDALKVIDDCMMRYQQNFSK